MFASLLFPYVLSNFYRAFLAVVAGDLSRDLGLDAAALASLQATFLLSFAVMQLPVGLSLDRIGPRRTLITGLTGAVAGSLLLAVAGHYWEALLAMALLGAGFAPVLMTGFYLISRSYPPARFATLSSLMFGLGTLGDPLSGTPLTLAVAGLGWRTTMLVMAGLTAASLACVVAVVRNPPPVEHPGGPVRAWAGIRQVLSLRPLWPMLPVAFVSYAVIAATRGLWIAPYLSLVHHFGPHAVGVSATAMGVAIAAGGLLYGPLNRLFGDAKYTVIAGVASTMVAWLVLGLAGDRSAPLAIALLLFAGCLGATFAIVVAHARAFMPVHLLGLGVTIMNLVFFVGAALGQWLSGRYVRAAELAAVAPADIYGRLFTGFSLVLLVALGFYLLAPREKRVLAGKDASTP